MNIPLKRLVGGPRSAIFFLSHGGDGDAGALSLGGLENASGKPKSGNPIDGRGTKRWRKKKRETAARPVPIKIRRWRRVEQNLLVDDGVGVLRLRFSEDEEITTDTYMPIATTLNQSVAEWKKRRRRIYLLQTPPFLPATTTAVMHGA